MKKLLTLLFVLLAVTAANAQILKGDMNGDGKITMADANEVTNTYLGTKAAETLSVYAQDKVDDMNEKILQKLESIDARLAAIEAKLSIEGGGATDDKTPAGVEAVDLGLSVKWATCNVGASKPEDYGDYFAWGETTGYNSGKTSFYWSTYKWCKGSDNTQTKYCTSSSCGTVDNKKVLEKADDAAAVNWGGSWRMPTWAEQDELRNTSNCTWTWTTMNGVNGYMVTSKKNGNSIFLPAAGCRDDSSLDGAGSVGYYWSSSLDESPSYRACGLYFDSSYVGWCSNGRFYGLSVRAVCQ